MSNLADEIVNTKQEISEPNIVSISSESLQTTDEVSPEQSCLSVRAVENDSIPFKCQSCFKPFPLIISRDSHERSHKIANQISFNCFNCKEPISNPAEHEMTCQPTAMLCFCRICGQISPEMHSHDTHVATHNLKQTFHCYKCGKYFSNSKILCSHTRYYCTTEQVVRNQEERHQPADDEFETNLDGAACYSLFVKMIQEELAQKPESSAESEKPTPDRRSFKCRHCEQSFSVYRERVQHEKLYHRVRGQPQGSCAASFPKIQNCQSHEQSHLENSTQETNSDDQFIKSEINWDAAAADDDEESTDDNNSLTVEVGKTVHDDSAKRPRKIPFNLQTWLSESERIVPIGLGKRRGGRNRSFKCRQCDARFCRHCERLAHERSTHRTTGQCYQCRHCGKSFRRIRDCDLHERQKRHLSKSISNDVDLNVQMKR